MNTNSDEYMPYKNYKAREVIPETEEEALLLKINESEFALNDISLYLDLHPNDYDMYRKFREETNKLLAFFSNEILLALLR